MDAVDVVSFYIELERARLGYELCVLTGDQISGLFSFGCWGSKLGGVWKGGRYCFLKCFSLRNI